jgi:hypothetical protein
MNTYTVVCKKSKRIDRELVLALVTTTGPRGGAGGGARSAPSSGGRPGAPPVGNGRSAGSRGVHVRTYTRLVLFAAADARRVMN